MKNKLFNNKSKLIILIILLIILIFSFISLVIINFTSLKKYDDVILNNIYVDEYKRRIRFILSSEDLEIDLNTNLLFVYIIVEGTPASDTPCGFDNKITIAPIYNKYPIYKNSIYLLSEFNNQCKI